MRKIFIGFLLIFLDFNLTFGNCTLGLLPDFVGYILLMRGLDELVSENPRFKKIRPWALGMAIYTGILYAADIFGLSTNAEIIAFILGLASIVISLYISYNITAAVQEMETAYMRDLNAKPLMSAWTVLAVLDILTYALLLIPVLNLFCIIGAVVAGIVFLVQFNRTKNRYCTMRG